MTQVRIDSDEWYPVYFLSNCDYGGFAEIPDDKLEWINKTFDEFDKVQDYLRNTPCEWTKS